MSSSPRTKSSEFQVEGFTKTAGDLTSYGAKLAAPPDASRLTPLTPPVAQAPRLQSTSDDIVARLNIEMAKVLKLPDLRERAEAEGADLVGNAPEAFAVFLDAEINKWAKVIKISGARSE